jgi:hypothetical protein
MRALGVNLAAGRAYLTVVDAPDTIVAIDTEYLEYPDIYDGIERFKRFYDDTSRLITTYNIEIVCVLDPETNYDGSFTQLRPRIEAETAILYAANEEGIVGIRFTRAKVRSLTGVGSRGKLAELVGDVIQPVGRNWANRGVAALAAIAGLKE